MNTAEIDQGDDGSIFVDVETLRELCICPAAPGYAEDEPNGLCLGVPGETNDCASCLVLDPEEPCLHDPERVTRPLPEVGENHG